MGSVLQEVNGFGLWNLENDTSWYTEVLGGRKRV